MKQNFSNSQYRIMLAYFLLAVAIILAFRAIQEIDIVFQYVNRLVSIISPFIYGFLIAYILNLPCTAIQRLLLKTKNNFICKKSKMLSVIITYILVFLLLYLTIRLIVPSIYNSIYFFIANYQNYYNGAQEFINSVSEWNLMDFGLDMDGIMLAIRDFSLEKLPQSINALVGVPTAIFGALAGVPSALLRAFLILISSIYILFEKDKFKEYLCRMLKAFFPKTWYQALIKYSTALNKNFKQYIYTQTIDGCILGTIVTIELYLMGSPYALILGIILGFVNYIPYFGSIFGTILAIIVVAFTQNLPTAALATVILFITQQIDGNVIQPRLLGDSFALSPLLIIISITIGGAFYGIFGMLAAIPIVAVMKNIFDEIIVHCEKKHISESKDLNS